MCRLIQIPKVACRRFLRSHARRDEAIAETASCAQHALFGS